MYKLLIVAGEASGDLLGAHLCQALWRRMPSLQCVGMGGPRMRAAGVEVLIPSDTLAVIGSVEAVRYLKKIYQAFRAIHRILREHKPHAVVLIDYPGFNLRVAKLAKKQRCKVFYYVSPQLWAWNYGRIRHIRKYVDHMAVLFPFEEKLYQKEQVPVSFVGHPIVEIARPTIDRESALERFHLKPGTTRIGLFPGSRQQEVKRLLPVLLNAASIIKTMAPETQFILPLANTLSMKDVQACESRDDILIVKEDTYNALSVMDAAVAVSGTVTLEIALQKVPLVLIYKTSPLTYYMAKRLIRVPYIGLCNLVAEGPVAREFIQQDATPEAIAEEIIALVTNPQYRQFVLEKLDKVTEKLGSPGASDRAATAVLRLLAEG